MNSLVSRNFTLPSPYLLTCSSALMIASYAQDLCTMKNNHLITHTPENEV